jgi:hypothetical protein
MRRKRANDGSGCTSHCLMLNSHARIM